ncbi:ubiquitin-like protein 7 isoform X2 [Kogia breviceps]|uniref:ubiquitin-like protein 7 isoform X2 n=1 Tax=Kogia breviceps TaxID=27615 RepID=UPI0034D1B624
MPGGFLFEGLSDDEDDFHPSARSTPSSSTPSSRPASLGYSGAAGPRPITQSELATALALASTPESSSHTPTPGTQGHSSGTSPVSSGVQSGTPITNDLFSQALQHALQASGQPSLQSVHIYIITTQNKNESLAALRSSSQAPSQSLATSSSRDANFNLQERMKSIGNVIEDFPGDTVVENLPANVADTGLSRIRENPTC